MIDSPVSVTIHEPISLQSALNVILSQFGLIFTVENEVILVTSPNMQKPVQKTYYVGDLVQPIPNMSNPLQTNFLSPGNLYNPASVGWNQVGQGRGGQMSLPPQQATGLSPVSRLVRHSVWDTGLAIATMVAVLPSRECQSIHKPVLHDWAVLPLPTSPN